MNRDALAKIMKTAEGLLYPSETDAPFDAVRWGGKGTLDEAAAKVAAGRPVLETTVGDLFDELEGSDEGERWRALRGAIEGGLSGVRVFRIGERRVDVYVVGRGPSGEWAGLHTTSVET
jgi:hypothetical protein